jgi:hypothetical protein
VHLKAQESTLLSAIKKAFGKAAKDVQERLKAWQKENPALTIPEDAATIVDSDSIAAILEAQTGKAIKDVVLKSLKTACAEIGENWNAVKSDFDDIIDSVVAESASRITSVADTLKADVQTVLTDNAQASADQIAEQLSSAFEAYSGTNAFKAARIARTTATLANGKSQDETFGKFDFGKEWVTKRDGDVRSNHRRMDGQRADADGYFTSPTNNKARYPGGFGVAEEDIECRCVLFPVKED